MMCSPRRNAQDRQFRTKRRPRKRSWFVTMPAFCTFLPSPSPVLYPCLSQTYVVILSSRNPRRQQPSWVVATNWFVTMPAFCTFLPSPSPVLLISFTSCLSQTYVVILSSRYPRRQQPAKRQNRLSQQPRWSVL